MRLGRQAPAEDSGIWQPCPKCRELIYVRELQHNLKVCPRCSYHHRLSARERIAQLADPDSFEELFVQVEPTDPLNFTSGSERYIEKLQDSQQRAGLREALVCGTCTVEGLSCVLAVADFNFMGASMGSVYGEKLARAAELALSRAHPLLVVSSSGGARMQEGVISLMQMAKTVAAVTLLRRHKVPYISVLADPCFGGVTASYALIADVVLAEPGALIGFAGPRVIEQITKQKLPPGFQTAEFLLDHGMIDQVVPRNQLRGTISRALRLFALNRREASV